MHYLKFLKLLIILLFLENSVFNDFTYNKTIFYMNNLFTRV